MASDSDGISDWQKACLTPLVTIGLADGVREMAAAFIRRSAKLSQQLEEAQRRNKGNQIQMKLVSCHVFDLFFQWSYMELPALDRFLKQDEVLALARLGKQFQIHLLMNQTSDRLRENLTNKNWELTPELTRSIWTIHPHNEWIGGLVSVAIGWVVAQNGVYRSEQQLLWLEMLEKLPALYRSLARAGIKRLGPQSLKAMGTCHFHDHSWSEESSSTDHRGCVHGEHEAFFKDMFVQKIVSSQLNPPNPPQRHKPWAAWDNGSETEAVVVEVEEDECLIPENADT